jgi:hypothetical protein
MESGCTDPDFLDLGTSWSWSASGPGRFTPPVNSPRNPLDRRMGGPQSRSGRLEKRKFLTLPGLELRPLSRQLVASRYTDCAIPTPRYGLTTFNKHNLFYDRLYGIVVRVPGYRFRGSGLDSRSYQIF